MDDYRIFQHPDKRPPLDSADGASGEAPNDALYADNHASAARDLRYAPRFDADGTDAPADAGNTGDVATIDGSVTSVSAPMKPARSDAAWARPYQLDESPRRQGTQRSLEEALVNWWSDGTLPPPPVVRDGLMMLEAGIDVEESHRSLLLRSALAYRRGMLTALKHQQDPERTALIMREALLDGDAPLPVSELSRLMREDPGSTQWLPRLEAELVTPALSADPVRSARANAVLIHLADPAETPDALLAMIGSERRRLRVAWQLVALVLMAFLVAAAFGVWARARTAADFTRIPTGTFAVFNPDGTTREVAITGYWLARFEVTNGDYRQCVDKGECPAPTNPGSATRTGYFDDPAFDAYPVVHVERDAARAYCRWRGGRLPTESEWQVGASYSPVLERSYRYPWGDRYATGLANDVAAATGDTLQVGSLMPAGASPWGAADFAGNVAEWTLSDAQDGSAIVKGGSFLDDATTLQSGARQLVDARDAQPWLGFRCVMTPFSLW